MKFTDKTVERLPSQRKPYSTPRLVSYGHVKDIVQGSTGGMTGDGSGTTKPCWVAEALYGAHDPRTILLRAWLCEIYRQGRRGWPLVALYVRFGQRVAKLIANGRLPHGLLLPLFDFLGQRAFEESADRIGKARLRL